MFIVGVIVKMEIKGVSFGSTYIILDAFISAAENFIRNFTYVKGK